MRRTLGVVILLAACKTKSPELAPQYCSGGIINDRGLGDCMVIRTVSDAGAEIAGTAFLTNHLEHSYTLKRNGPGRFHLLLDGVVAGALLVNGDWIEVTLLSDTHQYKLRSDAPGFLN